MESILLQFKNNGYLGSKLGKKGGYFLIKKPEEITLLEIVRLSEGSIALLRCTSVKYYEPCDHCKDELTCSIRGTFKEIRDFTFNKLEKTSLAMLAQE